ncbi:hypothetical protein M2305_001273 [Gluconobacter cerinus]|uniref:hypothetical protein n=1 Tax=Gluconobacter cerinus TaxID=38307 RepID=UPI002227D6BB|nr:hypothetical protein [Gluconobacter cerinus]MCW2265326.1 hypothetical protein [Gluconobacter cerinus]
MGETTSTWVGLADALHDIVSAQVWDQCLVAWDACKAAGGYASLEKASKQAQLRYWARTQGSTSLVPNVQKLLISPELQDMKTAFSLLQREIVSFLCSGEGRVRFYKPLQGDYSEPPSGFWRQSTLCHYPPRTEPPFFEDVFRACWIQLGSSVRVPVDFIQILQAVEAVTPEPAVSSMKKPGGPGRPEKAETTFARSAARAWLEEEGELFEKRGEQADCERYVLGQLEAKKLTLSEAKVRSVVKEESAKLAAKKDIEKLKAEKEKARKSASNWNG